MIREDPNKLTIANPAGLCAAHNAAARNRVAILALIAEYSGGKSISNEIYCDLKKNKHHISRADLNLEDKNGWTPLHHAARNNSVKAIEFLLDHGVDDIRLNKQNEAAIHITVIHNQLNALEVCLSANP